MLNIQLLTGLPPDVQTVFGRFVQAGLASEMVLLESQNPASNADSVAVEAWSYIACSAVATLQQDGLLTRLLQNKQQKDFWQNPFVALQEVANWKGVVTPLQTPVFLPKGLQFSSGWIGYLGYDLVRFVEQLSQPPKNSQQLPDLHLHWADHVLAFDHTQQNWWFCTTEFDNELWHATQRHLIWQQTLSIAHAHTDTPSTHREPETKPRFYVGQPQWGTDCTKYHHSVDAILDWIRAGDVFQTNLSHVVYAEFSGNEFALYQALTHANPALFSAYINIANASHIASVSPERFLRLQGRSLEAKPIKGTSKRGKTHSQDIQQKQALASSTKDRAENVMIVDLMRNDLGRVACIGSVKVPLLFDIEAHPSVWQMVSTITATLHPDCTGVDALRACWPPGSMTGTPKIRAMEIIDTLEPTQRGVYSGAIGYLASNGNMDWSVVIRTAVVTQGKVHVQVGGAVVIDSTAASEWEETHAKGAKLFKALGWQLDGGVKI